MGRVRDIRVRRSGTCWRRRTDGPKQNKGKRLTENKYLGDERETLKACLNDQREAMVRAIHELDEKQARFKPCEEANSLIELVNHLTWVELWWFGCVFSGEPDPWPDNDDPDIDFRVPNEQTVEQTVGAYAARCRQSNEIFDSAALDQTVVTDRGGRSWEMSLRWIVVHMIEETARHAGHADITRQLIDGYKAT